MKRSWFASDGQGATAEETPNGEENRSGRIDDGDCRNDQRSIPVFEEGAVG
jgi:hypothetical protein